MAQVSNIIDRCISRVIQSLQTTLVFTQEQFAAKIGVTFSTVNRWENGEGKPSPLAMKQIEELRKKLQK